MHDTDFLGIFFGFASGCGFIAASLAHRERHIDAALFGDRADEMLGIDNLGVVLGLDISRGNDTGTLFLDAQGCFGTIIQTYRQILEVQQNIDDILLHALDG